MKNKCATFHGSLLAYVQKLLILIFQNLLHVIKRLFFLLLFCLAGLLPIVAHAAPSSVSLPPNATFIKTSIGTAKPEKKKAGLITKWKNKLVAKAIKKGWLGEGEITERQKKWAKWSMILGIGSLVALFIPGVNLVAIPAAIEALVFGIKSVEGNSNTQGIIGIIAGGLTLVLLIAAIALLVAFFASWN